MNASVNIVNDAQKEHVVQSKFVQSGQEVIGKFAFHNRNAAFDFGAFAVKDSGKLAAKFSDNGMKHASGAPAANANRVSGFEIRTDITVIGQGIEAFVQGQASDSNPGRFFPGHGLEFSEISCGTPTDVLTENQKRFFFDQNDLFDVGSGIPFPLRLRAFRLIPLAFDVMRSRIAQPISRTVAQGVFVSGQSLFQVLQKIQKQLLQQLPPQTLVKLLKRRVIGTLYEAQKLLQSRIAQDLFFGLAVRP